MASHQKVERLRWAMWHIASFPRLASRLNSAASGAGRLHVDAILRSRRCRSRLMHLRVMVVVVSSRPRRTRSGKNEAKRQYA
jgi:hypothetical protein